MNDVDLKKRSFLSFPFLSFSFLFFSSSSSSFFFLEEVVVVGGEVGVSIKVGNTNR